MKRAFSILFLALGAIYARHADVNQRGDGGVIQVDANDPKDTESRDQIRMHPPRTPKPCWPCMTF